MSEAKSRGGAREGAGRKAGPDGPTIVIAASVPESLVNQLDAIAAQQGWSRSAAITAAIRNLVKRAPKPAK
jgi:predicted DCC family thiol-disulfide oxidoreductase YuxK